MKASTFDALPGYEVPVDGIAAGLASMWDQTTVEGAPTTPVEDIKATQVNLVLHFGFGTDAADAVVQFQTALRFSVRYPSRVVVLCPLPDEDRSTEYRAKIYGECFLGKSKDDTRCVEFVILSYPASSRQYLENQVSICLSNDLPLYYWVHRFSSNARLNDYHYLLGRSKRVLYDSGVLRKDSGPRTWPRPEAVRDLAYARLLHVRQSLGQFLSGFTPAMLIDGLQAAVVAHSPAVAAEAEVLKGWIQRRLAACGARDASCSLAALQSPQSRVLEVTLQYSNRQRFHWQGDIGKGSALISAVYGSEKIELPGAVTFLSPEAALAEAMFF